MKHIPFNPTPEQRANLMRLAAHLDLGVTNLEFDMWLYSDIGYDASDYAHACGTVGCAVGHGPTLGIEPLQNEDWEGYCVRAFGCPSARMSHLWMFGSTWLLADNTPRGAAARIRYALKYGIPENTNDQMLGIAPLSYTVADRVDVQVARKVTEADQ